jgi:hypothetical protein
MDAEIQARLAELGERVARLERQTPPSERDAEHGAGDTTAEAFWALRGLRERLPADTGAVLFTGSVPLPTGEHYEWQQGAMLPDLLALDWSEYAAALGALGHPVRLLLLRQIIEGAGTVTRLREHEALGTTGQLYHHLRQLVAAGWLQTSGRGHYVVPGHRIVPLLVVLATVAPPAARQDPTGRPQAEQPKEKQ